jgi:hypothetical protein
MKMSWQVGANFVSGIFLATKGAHTQPLQVHGQLISCQIFCICGGFLHRRGEQLSTVRDIACWNLIC